MFSSFYKKIFQKLIDDDSQLHYTTKCSGGIENEFHSNAS